MIPILPTMLDALRDFRDRDGHDNKQLALMLGVTPGTLSRWFSGDTKRMKPAIWKGVLDKLGLQQEIFEKAVVRDPKVEDFMQTAMEEPNVTVEQIAEGCGVSTCTVDSWREGDGVYMRLDLFERFCDFFGGAPDAYPVVSADEMAKGQERSEEEGTVGEFLKEYRRACEKGENARTINHALVKDAKEYAALIDSLTEVEYHGKVRMAEKVKGMGTGTVLTVNSHDTSVTDGEQVAFMDRDEMLIGRIHFVPVLVLGAQEG